MGKFKRTILIVLVLILMRTNFVNGQRPQEITRVGFVKEIIKVIDVEIEEIASAPFSDISNKEDLLYLATAFNKKIVSGHGGAFNPEEPVTKEQAIIMLVRALGVINISQDEASKTEINFSDSSEISHWARPYIAFAIKYGLIENSENEFNPQTAVTKADVEQMLMNFKQAFVKEGLKAAQILELADNKLKEYHTYKFRGFVDITGNVNLPNGEKESIVMQIHQDGSFETPETIYTISKNIADIEGHRIEDISEVYMKNGVVYFRTGQDQQWIEMDLSVIDMQVEAIAGIGNIQQGLPQFSSQQLDVIGMYARYGEDIEIDGQKYYVIKVDLDTEAFVEMYNKIIDETFEDMFKGEIWEEIKKEQGIPDTMDEEVFEDTIKSAVDQLLENMKIQMMQEYYIHKENKHYSKLIIKQLVDMDLMGVETKVHLDGQYEYYDFGEEVIFPKIN